MGGKEDLRCQGPRSWSGGPCAKMMRQVTAGRDVFEGVPTSDGRQASEDPLKSKIPSSGENKL